MSARPEDGGRTRVVPNRAIAAWALYDWANSAFTTVVITFVFATYFAKSVAVDPVTGAAQWGYANSASAFLIAILAPFLGAVADKGGPRKPWVFGFTVLAVSLTAGLWFIEPDPSFVPLALILIVLANVGFEMGIVFTNAMLPDIASKSMIGRVSGWAWGLGYFGGLACLVIILVGFDTSSLIQIRATSLLVAVWFAVFAVPLFLFTPDVPPSGLGMADSLRGGLQTLINTLKRVKDYRVITRFLIARLIYNDGLVTLFAMGGVFAASAFQMTTNEILQFAVFINITAGIGAIGFAWIDDWIGSKRTILISLIGLIILGGVVVSVETKSMFLVFGSALGFFVGPVQAASRSMMAHLAPEDLRTEMFGLFAFSGKATAFLGPLLFGLVTTAVGSARGGMATILVFFLLGGLLLLSVPEPKRLN